MSKSMSRSSRQNNRTVETILDEVSLNSLMTQEGIEYDTTNTPPDSSLNDCPVSYAYGMREERHEDSLLSLIIQGTLLSR